MKYIRDISKSLIITILILIYTFAISFGWYRAGQESVTSIKVPVFAGDETVDICGAVILQGIFPEEVIGPACVFMKGTSFILINPEEPEQQIRFHGGELGYKLLDDDGLLRPIIPEMKGIDG